MRWEVSGCTAVVLLGAAAKICSEQHFIFLCSSNQVFSLCVSFGVSVSDNIQLKWVEPASHVLYSCVKYLQD